MIKQKNRKQKNKKSEKKSSDTASRLQKCAADKLKEQNGYILLFTIFFLCCALLCTSVLMLNLSDRYAASNEAVEKEQSWLLARSGWNLALEQMQLEGCIDAIQLVQPTGTIDVSITESSTASASWQVEAKGSAGVYQRTASGIVQCFPFPFAGTGQWSVIAQDAAITEASILLAEDTYYTLQGNYSSSLGITSADAAVSVEVVEDVSAVDLYIYGDLSVAEDAVLTAEYIYVSGEIYGAEQISCAGMYSHYTDALPYQIRVLERSVI